jgi:hypothetical protein
MRCVGRRLPLCSVLLYICGFNRLFLLLMLHFNVAAAPAVLLLDPLQYPPAPLRPPPAPPAGPQTRSPDASGPAPAPPPPPVEAASSDSTGSGVIVGAAVGAVAGLAAVGALVLVAVRQRRRRPAAALQSVSVKGAGVQDDWLANRCGGWGWEGMVWGVRVST